MRKRLTWWTAVVLFGLGGPVSAADNSVQLPLSTWQQMLRQVEQAEKPQPPPMSVFFGSREINGSLRKGLFKGTLRTRFNVLPAGGHVRVPVLDSAASLGNVQLNGRRTSLLKDGGLYTVGIDKPGTYDLTAEFFWGREQDRFSRRLAFRLPTGGATRVSVLVPEHDIEARLDNGALVSQTRQANGTRLVGQLDPSGQMSLSWSRRLTHKAVVAARLEARVSTLFSVSEALISGLAVLDLAVLEGETDRVTLQLPENIEVVQVDGDAVLQWLTENDDGEQLTILFRYLVEEQTRVSVHFQFPMTAGETIPLRMPLPRAGTAFSGAWGVQAPAGLDVKTTGVDLEENTAIELPRELTDLTTSPLLFGQRFSAAPEVGILVTRHEEVELTSTLIDDLQASSVLLADGSEVTKLKLRIRNNTRQYLGMTLPAGAVLTHSLIDGQPMRPATNSGPEQTALLLPLRQSERIDAGRERIHTVAFGDTLSDLANFYYSDPAQWSKIIDANPDQLGSEWDLTVGQKLRIPARAGAMVEESSFVIELAYKRKHDPLGDLGRATVVLPSLDVDTTQATWHVYLPAALLPLGFSANLTQYSAIRYDPFRRVRDFLWKALSIRSAWAGAKYQNILTQRKTIYRTEVGRRTEGKMILSAFPLVGERYRFKRILLGQEAPRVAFFYVARDVASPVRWLAFGISLVLGLILLGGRRDRRNWLVAGGVLLGLLVVAYFVLGVHRRMVWGIDMALLITLVRLRGRQMWRALIGLLESPWRVIELLTLRNLLLVIGSCVVLGVVLLFPLLLSTVAFVVLYLWWRWSRRSTEEVAHA